MPLNGWLALAALAALLLSPLLLLTCPIWALWLWRQRRRAQAEGWCALLPFMAETVAAAAEAMIRAAPPDGGWLEVARRADDYLAALKLSRRWRAQLVVIGIFVLPSLRLRAPFPRLAREDRIDFVDRHLSTTRGLPGLVSLGRQLVRMGYYALPAPQRALGFVPVGQRRGLRAGVTPPGTGRAEVTGVAG